MKVGSNQQNTSVKVPSDADLKYQLASSLNWNDKFLMWVSGRVPIDRQNDKLMNDETQKWSAYNMFGTQGALQNGLVLKATRLLFGGSQSTNEVVDTHADFNGVQTHENSIFLYQSKHAKYAVRWGYSDFTMVALWAAYAASNAKFLLLPSLVSLLFTPRRWT